MSRPYFGPISVSVGPSRWQSEVSVPSLSLSLFTFKVTRPKAPEF